MNVERDEMSYQKPMSMYFKYDGKARPEIKSASTFDAILAGERTGTTRFPDWYKYNPALYEQLKQIPPGTELKFFDTQRMSPESRVVTVRTVPTKRSQSLGLGGSAHELTYQDLVDNPQWLELWSKREGWSPTEGLNFFRKYGKGTQIPFELVGDRRIATPVAKDSTVQLPIGRIASDVLEPRGEVLPRGIADDLGQQYLKAKEANKLRDSLAQLAAFANKHDVPY
jgi:hypothetical protein